MKGFIQLYCECMVMGVMAIVFIPLLPIFVVGFLVKIGWEYWSRDIE